MKQTIPLSSGKITPDSAPSVSVKIEIFALIALLLVVYVIALPGLSSALFLDDKDQLNYVSRFKNWGDCFAKDSYGLFRPFKNMIFYGLGDVSIRQWHLFNLSFFLAAIVAVYGFLRRLLQSPVWAYVGTVFWATCPTQASAAIWMSCVNISLAVIFICACLYCHDRSRDGDRSNWLWVGLASFYLILAQCSYESAVAAPGLCVLVDLLRRRPVFSKKFMLSYGIYGAITFAYLVIRYASGSTNDVQQYNLGYASDLQKWQLVLSAPWFLWRHFSMWLFPPGRIEFGSSYLWGISASPVELAGAWLWLFGIVAIIFLTRKREPWISFGLLWFLFASFPSSNFLPICAGPIEDYYLVIPSIGLAVALLGCGRTILACMVAKKSEMHSNRKHFGRAILAIGVIYRLLGVPLFWYQASLWINPVELYLSGALTRPAQYQLQSLAARELFMMGEINQAEELIKISYDTCPRPISTGLLARIRKKYDESMYFVDGFYPLCIGEALMTRPETKYLTREALLPLLDNTKSRYHIDAVNLLLDHYLQENKLPEARNAALNGLKFHPTDIMLARRMKSINAKMDQAPSKSN